MADKTSAPRTRLFRNIQCPIIKTTKNLANGAIYDLVQYERKVTNAKDGTTVVVKLARKLRRPGTGSTSVVTEVEVIEDELLGLGEMVE